jgi:hypothetical protein
MHLVPLGSGQSLRARLDLAARYPTKVAARIGLTRRCHIESKRDVIFSSCHPIRAVWFEPDVQLRYGTIPLSG